MSSYELSGICMESDREETEETQRSRMLTERVQAGDTEAFGELIEQHRNRAKMWAERMTGDPHMADDIVQDALIRAFLHIGSLQDTSRFQAWFHKIVRNQANMRLRRGGPYKREQPFATFAAWEGDKGSIDWDDLDSLLFHLTRSAANEVRYVDDPAESLMRKELYETIHSVLNCLSRKERDIFEAYFFKQLSPDEIAAMYQMTTGSIYTYIHRSRQKLRQEHIRISLGLQPEQGGRALNKSKLLQLPEWPASDSVMLSIVDRMGHLLATIGDRRETAELMGISGFAFRMQISDKTTYADGIYMFDWRATLRSFVQKLGYEATILCGQLSDSPVPLLGAVERFPVVLPIEEAVIPFIRKAIDAGKPVLYFDTAASRPYVHEWSLIYGYDDDNQTVQLTDALRPDGKSLSYEHIALNPVRFLVTVDRAEAAVKPLQSRPDKESAKRYLAEHSVRFAIEHAKNPRSYRPMTVYLSYTTGLSAYDRWIGHMRGDPAIPPNRYGAGQLAATYAQTRSCAAQYLRTLPFKGEAMRFVLLASEAYEQAGEALSEFSAAVPFMRTTEMLSREQCASCADWLEQARAFETAAIEYLEKAINHLEKGKSR